MTGTVGVPVSRLGLALAPPMWTWLLFDGRATAPELDSSIDRLAILPGAGPREDGILVGGACFFLTMSL